MIKMKEKDVTIRMGDFNAKIASNNRGYEEVMGTHGIGEMNEHGEMFADLCSFNRLIIGGSVFPHRRIHKATWVSPDHFFISQKFRRSMQDVRAPGPDEIPAEAIKADIHRNVVRSDWEDMGHIRNTNRMERRVPCKDSN